MKGTPIINDATLEDAESIGLDKLPGIKFQKMFTGADGSGIERGSREFLELNEKADVTISKGQGNYEALSEIEGIFFLLMAKCPIVAEDMNVKMGDFIVKLSE